MHERDAFLKTVLADPSDANRLIFADWLQDHGEEELARWLRQPHPPDEFIPHPSQGNGAGYGYGIGHGNGYRNGNGDGYNNGDESDYSFGQGDGEGSGHGEEFPCWPFPPEERP